MDPPRQLRELRPREQAPASNSSPSSLAGRSAPILPAGPQLRTQDECQVLWYRIGTPRPPFHGEQVLARIRENRFNNFKKDLWLAVGVGIRRDWVHSVEKFAWHALYYEIKRLVEGVVSGRLENRQALCRAIGGADFSAVRSDGTVARDAAKHLLASIEPLRVPFSWIVESLERLYRTAIASFPFAQTQIAIRRAFEPYQIAVAIYLVFNSHLRLAAQANSLRRWVEQVIASFSHLSKLEDALALFSVPPEKIAQDVNANLQPAERLQLETPPPQPEHAQNYYDENAQSLPPFASFGLYVDRSLGASSLSRRKQRIYDELSNPPKPWDSTLL